MNIEFEYRISGIDLLTNRRYRFQISKHMPLEMFLSHFWVCHEQRLVVIIVYMIQIHHFWLCPTNISLAELELIINLGIRYNSQIKYS